MTGNSYILRLTMRLSLGLSSMDNAKRDLHAQWILSKQQPDGGFPGREGPSDLYYTSFGLRALAILGRLDQPTAEKASAYLKSQLGGQATIVDFYSLLYSVILIQLAGATNPLGSAHLDWENRIVELLATLRTPDGGFAQQPNAKAGSTYQTFLSLLAHEIMARPVAQSESLVSFVMSRQREDGGFVEVAPARRGGTNPTAAAVGILKQVSEQSLSGDFRERIIDFLVEATGSEGGLRANDRVPLCDLLSSFTGIWTLAELGALDAIDLKALSAFLDAVEEPGGGFLAGVWDQTADVEYTFYGLGLRALANNNAPPI